MTMEDQKKILILGIGNLILKDEGAGVHVIERLKDMALPSDVEVIDGGTMGIDLLYYIEGRKKVIVIDAVNTDGPAGTIYRFTDKDLEDKKECLRSAHDIDFTDVLKTADLLGKKPDEVIFIGIKPEDISEGIGLSPSIEGRIPQIIELVLKEISSKTKS
jgi:hydrogenase maturation protease